MERDCGCIGSREPPRITASAAIVSNTVARDAPCDQRSDGSLCAASGTIAGNVLVERLPQPRPGQSDPTLSLDRVAGTTGGRGVEAEPTAHGPRLRSSLGTGSYCSIKCLNPGVCVFLADEVLARFLGRLAPLEAQNQHGGNSL